MVMEDILVFDTIKQYNAFNKQEALHPLVSIIDLSKAEPRQFRRMRYNFYTIFLKEIRCGDLRYGCNYYDYDEGTLIFLAPGQVIGAAGPTTSSRMDGFSPKLIEAGLRGMIGKVIHLVVVEDG